MVKNSKIAIFHPWIKSRGGAEKVILELLEKSKYQFEVYTWVYDKENTFPEFEKYKIIELFPKIGKRLARLHLLRGLFLPLCLFKKLPLEKYEKFLISTSGLAEIITFRNYKKGQTYAYVYTPLREANKKIIKWNLENRYKKRYSKNKYILSTKIYKFIEKLSWKRLDKIAFISSLSAERAKDHNLISKEKPKIIFPPVDIERFRKISSSAQDHFLYYSRLNPPKRQDLLIEAWKIFIKKYPNIKLIIAGTPENKKYSEKIQKMANETPGIEIKLNVGENELESLVAKSIAGIFLGYSEDFGIVPLEILSAKKPLIATDEGGYVDLIKNHKQFYPIKEDISRKKMIENISDALDKFMSQKNKKGSTKKIKLNDFILEMDNFLKN
jgi:glycosyltransferase involved in cell wall biosynthesis